LELRTNMFGLHVIATRDNLPRFEYLSNTYYNLQIYPNTYSYLVITFIDKKKGFY